MKYKIGDKVMVRSDMIVGQKYGYYTMLPSRKKYLGKIVTIKSYSNDDTWRGPYYIIKETSSYCWDEEMLEGLAGGKKIKKKVNSIINLPIRAQLDKLGI